MIKMLTRPELRTIERPVEQRAATDDRPTQITGYAALFDTPATIGGAFVEQIDQGAFDDALGDDVRVLFNHDPSLLLGRTTSGTASIAVDETGLRYTVTPPDTATGREVLELLQRGDVSGSSFGFQVLADRWTEGTTSADLPVRHLERGHTDRRVAGHDARVRRDYSRGARPGVRVEQTPGPAPRRDRTASAETRAISGRVGGGIFTSRRRSRLAHAWASRKHATSLWGLLCHCENNEPNWYTSNGRS